VNEVITVSQLNRYLKQLFDGSRQLHGITVQGELSNFTNHVRSGHFYFTLKDSSAAIRCVMFRSYASGVKFVPENGMKVLLTGSVSFFERDGNCQFYCEKMEPDGIGALALAFEQLKEKLRKEGLFDPQHKKPLPPFPKRIGVVTSKTGAAIQDIVNILSRRFPLGTLVLIPALVQGDGAPESICQGIAAAQRAGNIDVLIVGRGGGSIEDLWAFNDERVARAVFACSIPVISAVGHEVDFTITDFTADLRAPTPSAAAELCAPDLWELRGKLAATEQYLTRQADQAVNRSADQLQMLKKRLLAASPIQKLRQGEENLTGLCARLESGMEKAFALKNQDYLSMVSLLEAFNPLKVLTRGYSVTYSNHKIVTKTREVSQGSLLKTLLSDGEIYSRVCPKEEPEEIERKQESDGGEKDV
jgi:exodeoxyribonuclease VII large subunit